MTEKTALDRIGTVRWCDMTETDRAAEISALRKLSLFQRTGEETI